MSKHRHTHTHTHKYFLHFQGLSQKNKKKKTLNKKGMQKSYRETEQKDKQVELHRS